MIKNPNIRASLALAILAAATTAAFGATEIWTGPGTEIGTAANWGGTLPSTANNDTGEFNNTVTGPLSLTYNTGTLASGFGSSGVNLYLNAAQTSPVTILYTGSGAFSSPLAITDIQIDSGAGAFTLGGNSSSQVLNWVGRPAGAVHTMINNSANTATFNPWIQFTAGGGSTWTLDFSGTGNWQVNSYLVDNNGPNKLVQVDGPGTVTWNPTGYLGANGLASPITINGGTLVLTGSHPRLNNQTISMTGNFIFNAPAQSQTLSGPIFLTGNLQVSGGTLTLSGNNQYTGSTILAGGEMIANVAEIPANPSGPFGYLGTITFSGGTMGYSVNNNFDYSSRFDTSANQAYSIDTAGQLVSFATGLTSSGGSLAKLGSGVLTLAGANTYTGNTTVSAGKLVFEGTMSGTGAITVNNSTALGVTGNGSQIEPSTLTVGTTAGATLEFNSISSTSLAPLAPVAISAGGPVTVNVNSGTFTIGQSYPLLSWTSGTTPIFNVGTLTGFGGSLSVVGKTLYVTVSSIAYVWTGSGNADWDTNSPNNWKVNGAAGFFQNGGSALFDDSAPGSTSVTLDATVTPLSVAVSDNNLAYTITSASGDAIAGSGSFTKSGTATLTMVGGFNTYTGPTVINGGLEAVSVLADGGTASDIGASTDSAANLVLNGGTLQYTGANPVTTGRGFTLGTANGTLDSSGSSTLVFNNAGAVALSGSGPRILTLTGSHSGGGDMLAAVLGDNGGSTALTKAGVSTWGLTGNNTYSGVTSIEGGELQIGAGGTTGSLGTGPVVDDATLEFNLTSTLTVGGAISGTGSLINDGTGTVILTGNCSYVGGTTINNGTVQVGAGGAAGTLNANAPILDNGTLIFDSTTKLILSGFANDITGTGSVIVRPGCFLASTDGNTYSGTTEIDAGATFQPTFGNAGGLSSSGVTDNGALLFIRQDGGPLPGTPPVFSYPGNITGTGQVVKDNNNQNNGYVGLAGNNSYGGGTFIGGGSIVLGDNTTPSPAGTITGNVTFVNTASAFLNYRSLAFFFPDARTFSGNITSTVTDGSTAANSGALEQAGAGTVTLTGNNSYPGGTFIDAGTTLQVGAGGTSGTLGASTVNDGGTLVFDRSDDVVFAEAIINNSTNTSGGVTQEGSGTLDLTGANTYTGPTTAAAGALMVSGTLGGDLDITGGVLIPGSVGSTSTLTVSSNMNIGSGAIVATVNTSSAPTSSSFTVIGTTTATGGKLVLLNFGPALTVNTVLTIFNGPVTGAGNVTVVSPGFTTSGLQANGTVTVTGVSATHDNITFTVSGGQLNMSWPAAYEGLCLQTATSVTGPWTAIPGTSGGTTYSVPLPAGPQVYYRLGPCY